jgi:hypothetical protein
MSNLLQRTWPALVLVLMVVFIAYVLLLEIGAG